MRAVLPVASDRPLPSALPRLGELPDPRPAAGEVVLAVRATALNRADLLQMRGRYPPPAGESEVPGLECAGTVAELGPGVAGWHVGQRAMALVAGGGHGERVAVPVGQLMPIPEGMGFREAAAIPEVGLTAWTNLVAEGALESGESVLIVAAASGVGTFATQLARELGARPIVAGRHAERLRPLAELGAVAAVTLDDDLPTAVRAANGGDGVDLVLDLAGGRWTPLALAALRPRGRLVLVGVLAGGRAEIDLADLLRRRLRLVGSVLRARSRAEKAALVAAFHDFAGPRLADGRLRPIVDRVLPFAEVAAAYRQLEAGGIFGKIVLEM